MQEWEVTEDVVLRMRQMADQMDDTKERLQTECAILLAFAQEREGTLGPHSSDILTLIGHIDEINKEAGLELSKLSLKIFKAATIREAHLNGNRYSASNLSKKDEIIKQVIHQNVQADILPHNGCWENPEKPGEGLFVIDDDAEIITSKGGIKKVISGAELKKKYGIEGVYYHHNEPDFSPFVDDRLGIVEVDEIPVIRDGEGGTYDIAIKEVSKKTGMSAKEIEEYMIANRLTWHETADRRHIMAIPTEINTAFKHTGGISKQQSIQAMRDVWKKKFGGRGIVVRSGEGTVISGTVGPPVKVYSEQKKLNKNKK